MYQEAMEAMTESSVPGAFLVDVIPPREYNCLSAVYGRTLTSDWPPQSGIYLRGSPAYGSTRVRKE